MEGKINVNESGEGHQGWLPIDEAFATMAIHAGYRPSEHPNGPVAAPIVLASTFQQDRPNALRGFSYTRYANPTRENLERTLAALDEGNHALAFGSGSAAIAAVASLLNHGDGVIISDDVYAGSGTIFEMCKKSYRTEPEYVDLSDIEKFRDALKPNTKLIWVETPTNPMMKIVDLRAIAQIAHGYSKDILVAVDNTLLTAHFQKPLTLGADLSVYALTKFANGHSDVLMGAIVMKREDLRQQLYSVQKTFGAVPSPFDCYLLFRSLKTLHVRMPVHMRNGLEVAQFLQTHPKVGKVIHPGLPSHPQHELAKKQSAGHSGMVVFFIKEGFEPVKFMESLRLCFVAASFGGDQTTLELSSVMSKSPVPLEVQAKLGVTPSLVRLSVGLESTKDIIEDLKQALEKC